MLEDYPGSRYKTTSEQGVGGGEIGGKEITRDVFNSSNEGIRSYRRTKKRKEGSMERHYH